MHQFSEPRKMELIEHRAKEPVLISVNNFKIHTNIVHRINSLLFLPSSQSDNFSLPETTRSCWPVRPIPRRNFSHEPFGETNLVSSNGCNTAIGVVIPTTPNTTLHHQHQNHINEQLQQNSQQHNFLNTRRATLTPDYTLNVGETSPLLSMRVPDGAPQTMSIVNKLQNSSAQSTTKTALNIPNVDRVTQNICNGNFDDRLSQIQDYIRITTSLLHSINTDAVSQTPYLSLLSLLCYNINVLK